MVYPHYLAPTPSMAVVQFTPEPTLRGMPQGVALPAGTELRSLLGTEDQTNCEFRTAHPVRLLPIELARCRIYRLAGRGGGAGAAGTAQT